MTACIALLKLVLEMYDPSGENPLLPGDTNPGSDPGFQDDAAGKNQECREDEGLKADSDVHTEPPVTNAVEDAKLSSKGSDNGPVDGRLVSSGSDFLEKFDPQDGHDTVEEVSSQCAADISDDIDDKSVIIKASQVKGEFMDVIVFSVSFMSFENCLAIKCRIT